MVQTQNNLVATVAPSPTVHRVGMAGVTVEVPVSWPVVPQGCGDPRTGIGGAVQLSDPALPLPACPVPFGYTAFSDDLLVQLFPVAAVRNLPSPIRPAASSPTETAADDDLEPVVDGESATVNVVSRGVTVRISGGDSVRRARLVDTLLVGRDPHGCPLVPPASSVGGSAPLTVPDVDRVVVCRYSRDGVLVVSGTADDPATLLAGLRVTPATNLSAVDRVGLGSVRLFLGSVTGPEIDLQLGDELASDGTHEAVLPGLAALVIQARLTS